MSKKHRKKGKGDPSLQPGEADRLQSILEDPGAARDPASMRERVGTEAVALALLEALPMESPEALELVQAVQKAFPRKDVQKGAKKALFRLKQRGVEVDGGGARTRPCSRWVGPKSSPSPGPTQARPKGPARGPCSW